jgi:hypothetical protein
VLDISIFLPDNNHILHFGLTVKQTGKLGATPTKYVVLTVCMCCFTFTTGVFSAGADLKERAGMTQAETIEFVGQLRRTFTEVQV